MNKIFLLYRAIVSTVLILLFSYCTAHNELEGVESKTLYMKSFVKSPSIRAKLANRKIANLWGNEEWELSLDLAESLQSVGISQYYSSDSYYVLKRKSNKNFTIKAYSKITKDYLTEPDSETYPSIRIYLTKNHLLIVEERDWSNSRVILMGLAENSKKVEYLKLPEFKSSDLSAMPHVLGLSFDKIAIQYQNNVYYFELNNLKLETSLIFTIG